MQSEIPHEEDRILERGAEDGERLVIGVVVEEEQAFLAGERVGVVQCGHLDGAYRRFGHATRALAGGTAEEFRARTRRPPRRAPRRLA